MSFILDPSTFLYMSHDFVTMTVMCDIILTLSSKFQNKNKKKNRNRKEIENN